MEIDDALVRHIAHLSRLELTDEQVATFGRQLAGVLRYIDQLTEVDVEGVEPLAHAGDFANVLREDAARAGLPVDEALKNSPDRVRDFFAVPPVLEEPAGGP